MEIGLARTRGKHDGARVTDMADGGMIGPEHPNRTRRRNLRYFFYIKHHRSESSSDAQWSLSHNDEFSIFDEADFLDLSDAKGDLYGLLKRPNGSFETIGTRGEQLAEFPVTPLDRAWHGYPFWPLKRNEEGGRKARPSSDALEKMVEAAVLSRKQKSRLAGGKTI
jgi:hypothetical protein